MRENVALLERVFVGSSGVPYLCDMGITSAEPKHLVQLAESTKERLEVTLEDLASAESTCARLEEQVCAKGSRKSIPRSFDDPHCIHN